MRKSAATSTTPSTLSDGSSALVMGDVCGKGPEAAALTALSRYTIRAAAMDETDPQAILLRLNDALLDQVTDGRFVTVAFVRICCRPTGSGAGDDFCRSSVPACHRRRGRTPCRLPGNPCSASCPIRIYRSHEPCSARTESLVLYTDGLSAGQTTDDTGICACAA